jgi:hypothetical protein
VIVSIDEPDGFSRGFRAVPGSLADKVVSPWSRDREGAVWETPP